MEDAVLFRLFGGAKSLEEIDQMDIGRLSRALEAEQLAQAWEIVHNPNLDMQTKAPYQADIIKLKELIIYG